MHPCSTMRSHITHFYSKSTFHSKVSSLTLPYLNISSNDVAKKPKRIFYNICLTTLRKTTFSFCKKCVLLAHTLKQYLVVQNTQVAYDAYDQKALLFNALLCMLLCMSQCRPLASMDPLMTQIDISFMIIISCFL